MRRFRGGSVLVCVLLACAGCKNVSLPAFARPDVEIAVVAVKTELVLIGNAEQRYQVTYSRYGTLEDLQKEDLLAGPPDRNGYAFTAEINGANGFTVTAAPADAVKTPGPTLSIDEKMAVVEKEKDATP